MNDEYLWNKTGEDPEIEKLEKTLAVFRYREAERSEPVARPVYESVSRWRISLAFSFASLVIVAMTAVLWYQIAKNSEATDEIVFVQQSPAATDVSPIVEPKLPPARDPDGRDRPAGTRRPAISRTRAASRRTITKDSAPRDGLAALTKEERYAYRQLMLALSISGSKLKIVQDAIDGTVTTEDMEDNASKNQH